MATLAKDPASVTSTPKVAHPAAGYLTPSSGINRHCTNTKAKYP